MGGSYEDENCITEALEAEAVRIGKAISDKSAKNSKQQTELIEYLEKRFRLLDTEYETWPFNASMVPLVTAGLSVFLGEMIAG